MVPEVEENLAVDAVVNFIRQFADLDDVALLYSKFIVDGPIVIRGNNDATSDVFEDGKRQERC